MREISELYEQISAQLRSIKSSLSLIEQERYNREMGEWKAAACGLLIQDVYKYFVDEAHYAAALTEDKRSIRFHVGQEAFFLDGCNLPRFMIIHETFNAPDSFDVEIAKEAAYQTSQGIMMAKIIVGNNAFDIHIVTTDRTIECFKHNFDLYMEIFHDARMLFIQKYEELSRAKGQTKQLAN